MGRIVSRIERPPAKLAGRFAKVMLSGLVGGIDAPLLNRWGGHDLVRKLGIEWCD